MTDETAREVALYAILDDYFKDRGPTNLHFRSYSKDEVATILRGNINGFFGWLVEHGHINVPSEGHRIPRWKQCPDCEGLGEPCLRCEGTGFVFWEEEDER